MNDDVAGEAPAEAPDEVTPELAPDDRAIRVRIGNGPWRELPPSPPLSDDPEVEAIGELGMREVRKIIEDERDPRHAAALEYTRLQEEHMAGLFEGLAEAISPKFDALIGGAFLPKFSELVPDLLPKPNLGGFIDGAVSPKFSKLIAEGLDPFAGFAEAVSQNYREAVTDALPAFPAKALPELPQFDQATYLADQAAADEAALEKTLELVPPERFVIEPVAVPQVASAVVEPLLGSLKSLEEIAQAAHAEAARARAEAKTQREASDKALRAATRREWIGIGVGIAGAVVAVLALFVG